MKHTILQAKTVRIDHPEASYGIFCFNEVGDLFLSSDWGFFAYAWRSFGPDKFETFLASCNSDYLLGKFEITHQETTRKKIDKFRSEKVILLIDEFRKVLANQLSEQRNEVKKGFGKIHELEKAGDAMKVKYEIYIELLNKELTELVGIAAVHGWRSDLVEEGNYYRKGIEHANKSWQELKGKTV